MDQKEIFQSIADSLNKTFEETIYNLIGILTIVFILSLLPLLYSIFRKRKREKEWNNEYEFEIRKLNLSINEIDILEEMSHFLINSKRKILLLSNRSSFHNALLLWEKNHGKRTEYVNSLHQKLFNDDLFHKYKELDKPFGEGKPVRIISPEGNEYLGFLGKRENEFINIEKVQKIKNVGNNLKSQIFIQDSKGIQSHHIEEIKRRDEETLIVKLRNNNASINAKTGMDVLLYLNSKGIPVQTKLLGFKNRVGIIENIGKELFVGQTLKIDLNGKSDKIYHVNGTVKALSLNKKYAKISFGYVKRG